VNFQNLTDEELIEWAQGLNQSIFEVDCFGVQDLVSYKLILSELKQRGYEVKEVLALKIEKKGE